ncbi:MAG: hypothetical protein U0R52_09640 [Solirubrobacterales bacterium]
MARLQDDGSRIGLFGGDYPGWRNVCRGGPIGLEGRSILLERDREIVVGGIANRGYTRSGGVLARFGPDGRLDRSFGRGMGRALWPGVVEVVRAVQRPHDLPSPSGVSEVRHARGGGYLVGGYFDGKLMVARVSHDGRPDRSFGRGGISAIDVDGSRKCHCSYGTGMTRDRQGRIVLVGYTTNGIHQTRDEMIAVRFEPGGAIDRSFGKNGVVRIRPYVPESPYHYALARSVAIQPDGKIVIAGEADYSFTLARLRPDGHLDRSFFGDGTYTSMLFGSPSGAYDVIVDRRGRIVASGGGNGLGVFAVMRFLAGS